MIQTYTKIYEVDENVQPLRKYNTNRQTPPATEMTGLIKTTTGDYYKVTKQPDYNKIKEDLQVKILVLSVFIF